MVKITYIDSEGTARAVDAEEGSTVMENAIRNGIPGIEAECGGACACATCHVYVAEDWREAGGEPEPMEEDMLDFASDVRPNSRLSCRLRVPRHQEGERKRSGRDERPDGEHEGRVLDPDSPEHHRDDHGGDVVDRE